MAALLTQKKDQKDLLELDVGNILPGQEVEVNIQMMCLLKVEAATYCFKIPSLFFPMYKSMDGKVDKNFDYMFGYSIDIVQNAKLTYLSVPEGSNTED